MNCQLSWEQRSQYQFHASTSAQRATELCGDLPGAAPLAVSCSAVHHRIRIGMSEVIPHDVGTGLQRTLEHEWPWDGFEPTVKRFDHLQVNWGEHIGKPTRFTHGWKLPPSIDAPKTKFANMHEYALLHAKTFTFFHLDTIDPNKNMRLGGSWSYAPRTGAWLSLPKRHGSPSGAFFMKCQGPHRSFRSSCWNIWGNCSILPLIWRKCWMVEGRSKNRSVWQNFAVFCCAVCMRSTEVEKTHFTLVPPNILHCKDGETQILCIVVLYAQSQDARKWCHLDLQTNWFWFGGKTYQLLWSIWNLVDVVFLDVSTHIAAVYFVPRPEFWPAASTVFFWSRWYWYHYVGISINGSTQVYLVKWSILGVLLGTPINGHTHIIII